MSVYALALIHLTSHSLTLHRYFYATLVFILFGIISHLEKIQHLLSRYNMPPPFPHLRPIMYAIENQT